MTSLEIAVAPGAQTQPGARLDQWSGPDMVVALRVRQRGHAATSKGRQPREPRAVIMFKPRDAKTRSQASPGWRRGSGTRIGRGRVAILLSACLLPAACEKSDEAPSGGSGEPASSAASALAGRDARRKPDVVLVIVCSLRASHLGAAGYTRDTSPFLDSLAERGAFFETMVAASSWTKPSVASILTGLTPNVHRLTDISVAPPSDMVNTNAHAPPESLLADDIVTLAECLRDAGYATACRINSVLAGQFFNLDQGFDDAVTDAGLDAPQMVQALAEKVAGLDENQPLFFMLMIRDIHYPYDPKYEYFEKFNRDGRVSPEQYEELCRRVYEPFKRMRRLPDVPEPFRIAWVDLYDAELAQVDDALKKIPDALEEAGRLSHAVILVTGDHGERFFENHRVGHGHFLDQPVLDIPWIVAGSGIVPHRRYKDLVRSIDVYPTVADLAAAPTPPILQGRSVAPLLRGQTTDLPPVTAFASSLYKGLFHMVRDGTWKLHYRSRRGPELFDLAHDPTERYDLFSERPEVARRMQDLLDQWLAQEEELRQVVSEGQKRKPSSALLEQLRSLGYVDYADDAEPHAEPDSPSSGLHP